MFTKNDAPRLRDLLSEAARTSAELSALLSPGSLFYLSTMTPNGQGQPVMVLPGFLAGDWSSTVLRNFLDYKGYDSYGWDMGTNLIPDEHMMEKLVQRLEDIHERTGEKVMLIGHSLGGVISRELARVAPELVSKVITLGSPFGAAANEQSTQPLVREVFKILNPKTELLDDPEAAKLMLSPPPEVPTTSIYSRTDGVVHWKVCLNPESDLSENIELPSSHCGLIVNPLTYAVLFDRLAQPADEWEPFDRKKYLPLDLIMRRNQAHDDYTPEHPGERTVDRKEHPMFK